MLEDERLIRFDWAIKTILRDRANFDVLEGFLSALLGEEIEVLEFLENESPQESEEYQKFSQIDLMVRDTRSRLTIIGIRTEMQNDYMYMERLPFGTSKVIVDNLKFGEPYRKVAKVVSVSILYYNMGTGNDYVYHASTRLAGLHTGNSPTITKRFDTPEGITFREAEPSKDIFPEYYLIYTERFEDEITSELDEWIYMLKHETVPDSFRSRNIDKAREKLSVLKMKTPERKRYERYLMSVPVEKGHREGIA